MPSIYDYELGSYRDQLERLRESNPSAGTANLTHAALAHSNHLNLLLIGLCSLIEARLFELAEAQASAIKLGDVRGQGVKRLKCFLSRLGALEFGTLAQWAPFLALYEVRNSLVHSYGGLVLETQTEKVRNALAKLEFNEALVGGRRIRLTSDHLSRGLEIIRNLLTEIDQAAVGCGVGPPPASGRC